MKFLLRWTAHNSFLMVIALSLLLSPVDVSQADRKDQRDSSVSKARSSRVKARSPQARQKKRVKRRVVRTRKGKRVRQQRQVRQRPADRRGRNVVKKNSRRVRRQAAKRSVRRQRASQRRLTVAMLKRVPIKQRIELYRALVLTMGALELSRSSSAKVSYEQRHLLLELLFPLAHAQDPNPTGVNGCFFAGYPPVPCGSESDFFAQHNCSIQGEMNNGVRCNPKLFPTQPCVYRNDPGRRIVGRGYASTTACAYADATRMNKLFEDRQVNFIDKSVIEEWFQKEENKEIGLQEIMQRANWPSTPNEVEWRQKLSGLLSNFDEVPPEKLIAYYNSVGFDAIETSVNMVNQNCQNSGSQNKPFEIEHCKFFDGLLSRLQEASKQQSSSTIPDIVGGLFTIPPPPPIEEPDNPNCHKFSDLPGEHFCQARVDNKYMVVRLEKMPEEEDGQAGGCPTEPGFEAGVRRRAVVYLSDSPDGDQYCSDNTEHEARDYNIHNLDEIIDSRRNPEPSLGRGSIPSGEVRRVNQRPRGASISNLSGPCSLSCHNPATNQREPLTHRQRSRTAPPGSPRWSEVTLSQVGRQRSQRRLRSEGRLPSNVARFIVDDKIREIKKSHGKTNLCNIVDWESSPTLGDLGPRRPQERVDTGNFLPGIDTNGLNDFDAGDFKEKLDEGQRKNRNKCFDSDVVGLHEASLFLEHHKTCREKKIRVNESRGRSKRWLGFRSGDKKISDDDDKLYFDKPTIKLKLKGKDGLDESFGDNGNDGQVNVNLLSTDENSRTRRTWEDWFYGDYGDKDTQGSDFTDNPSQVFQGLVNNNGQCAEDSLPPPPASEAPAGGGTSIPARTGGGLTETPSD